jgi:hypothetical protein
VERQPIKSAQVVLAAHLDRAGMEAILGSTAPRLQLPRLAQREALAGHIVAKAVQAAKEARHRPVLEQQDILVETREHQSVMEVLAEVAPRVPMATATMAAVRRPITGLWVVLAMPDSVVPEEREELVPSVDRVEMGQNMM